MINTVNSQKTISEVIQEIDSFYMTISESIGEMLRVFTENRSGDQYYLDCKHELKLSADAIIVEIFLVIIKGEHRIMHRIAKEEFNPKDQHREDENLVKSWCLGSVLDELSSLANSGHLAVIGSEKLSPMKSYLEHYNSIYEIGEDMNNYIDNQPSKYYVE